LLIVPIHRKLSAKYFPVITAILILLNMVVFFGLQTGDGQRYAEAARYYVSSGLYEYEVPAYDAYRRSEAIDPETEYQLAFMQESPEFAMQWIEQDAAFLKAIETGQVELDLPKEDWQQKRRSLKEKMDDLFISRYQLSFSDSHWWQWLSHQFLHGSFGHLFGNMLFLALIGLLVEPALPAVGYLLSYLLAGVVAGTASWLLNQNGVSGLVGASGAIAGVMGMYAVLFGMRKVRFFYWVFVFFNYTKGPALLLLPAWLGWELFQLIFLDTRIAYEAHAAGLVSGALIAWSWRKHNRVDLEFLDEDKIEDERDSRLDEALDDLKNLRLGRAKMAFSQLIEELPDGFELKQNYFRACCLEARQRPQDLHLAAKDLLTYAVSQRLPDNKIVAWFDDYRKASEGKVKLSPQLMVGLSRSLILQGQREMAEKFVNQLAKQQAWYQEVDALKALMLRQP